ncbi:unnamed protein product [Peniophora sp. CBMAI 1063]|nr:unnamed protein product [Peniophora sp. CBMAI 1063]
MASTVEPLRSVVVSPADGHDHTATVIIAHGLGDTGHGWSPVASMLKKDPALAHVKWIMPHAPTIPITGNGGMPMPGWFDIYDFEFDPRTHRDDEQGMLRSMYALNRIITDEVDAGIPSDRIVLAGFSQGGAMTLLTGLTHERSLAGLAVMSGWAPALKTLKPMATENARRLPIFWGHGRSDPLVKWDFARQSLAWMQTELGTKLAPENISGHSFDQLRGVSLHVYDGLGHSASEEELDQLKEWLKHVIPLGL